MVIDHVQRIAGDSDDLALFQYPRPRRNRWQRETNLDRRGSSQPFICVFNESTYRCVIDL